MALSEQVKAARKAASAARRKAQHAAYKAAHREAINERERARRAARVLRDEYEATFMAVLRKPATPGRHANVLMHMMGHLKQYLDEGDKRELLALIDDHRAGLLPLVVPVTLLGHHARRLAVAYLLGQTYLEPHPKELMLRNHV